MKLSYGRNASYLLPALAFVLACGDEQPLVASTPDGGVMGPPPVVGESPVVAQPPAVAKPPVVAEPPAPGHCQAVAAEIGSAVQGQAVCTTVVRLDASSLAILGHSRLCGASAPVDEATARTLAARSAAEAMVPLEPKPELVGGSSEDGWVYLSRSGDFGQAVMIGARSGSIPFRAQWDWIWSDNSLRSGSILAPGSWSETDLGVGCARPARASVRALDLREQLPTPTPQPTSGEEAARVVLSTAIPAGLAEMGGAKSIVALLYPQWRFGEGHRLEWIVLINSEKAP
jgi:hypothetical protein